MLFVIQIKVGDTGLEKPKKPRGKRPKSKSVTPKAPLEKPGKRILNVHVEIADDLELLEELTGDRCRNPVRIGSCRELLELWSQHYGISADLHVRLRPSTSGSELLELSVLDPDDRKVADVVFSTLKDRMGKTMLSVRDQNTFDAEYRQKRLMALIHLFLIHRYKGTSVHYVSPTDDNQMQTKGMQALGIYDEVNTEVGDIIVARVNPKRIEGLLNPNQKQLKDLIAKKPLPKPRASAKSKTTK